jgi:hypothetical protein
MFTGIELLSQGVEMCGTEIEQIGVYAVLLLKATNQSVNETQHGHVPFLAQGYSLDKVSSKNVILMNIVSEFVQIRDFTHVQTAM